MLNLKEKLKNEIYIVYLGLKYCLIKHWVDIFGEYN